MICRSHRLFALAFLLPIACGDSSADSGTGNDEINGDTLDTLDSSGDQESGSSSSGTDTVDTTAGTDTIGTSTDTTDTTTADTTDTTTADTTDTADTTADTTTDTSTDTATDSTTGMTESSDTACDELQFTLDPLPPNVMIVLDKSRSMFINYWDHDNNANTPQITRWNSLYQVTNDIVTTFDDKINFGANLFPSTMAQNVYGPAACITSDFPEVTVNVNNGPAILAAIPGANVTNSYGGTPATLGIQTAYTHLQSLNPENPRAMILVTDGAANCDQNAQTNFELFEVYDAALPTLVAAAWNDDGIPTYVVGIDIANMIINDGVGGDPNNINPSQKLNEVAQVGGTGSFFNSQDQAELEAALNEVIESVKTCTILLDPSPAFPDYTKVIINGMEWPKFDDCTNQDGWMYTDMNYDSIELCGAACDALKQFGEADIEYYCNPG